MSAADLNDYVKALHNYQTGDPVSDAGQIAQKHVWSILDQGTPITGGGVGAGGDTIRAANDAFGRSQDLARLGTNPSGLTPGKVSETLDRYPGGTDWQGSPIGPEAQSLTALQSAMEPRFNFYNARHMAAPLLGAGLGGAAGFFNSAEGQHPGLSALQEAGEGAMIFGLGKALATPRPGPALNAARYAIGTGQPLSTGSGRLGNALLNLMLGRSASNQPY